VGLPGADDVILGAILLQHEPHRLDVFWSISPVTLCLEVAEIEFLLFPLNYAGNRPGDLAGDEGLPPPWELVIKQDAIAREQVIAIPIVPAIQ